LPVSANPLAERANPPGNRAIVEERQHRRRPHAAATECEGFVTQITSETSPQTDQGISAQPTRGPGSGAPVTSSAFEDV
jgi:hypothetical protein